MRAEQSRETVYEWFEWLTDRLRELPEFTEGDPAHVAHRNWRP